MGWFVTATEQDLMAADTNPWRQATSPKPRFDVKRQENDSGDASKLTVAADRTPHRRTAGDTALLTPEAGSTGEQDGLRQQASQ